MRNIQMNGYTQGERCYVRDGIEVTDFILGVKKIIFVKGGRCEYKFVVTQRSEKTFERTITLQQLKRHCFLQELSVFVKERDEFYKQLYLTVSEIKFAVDEIEYQTEKNGLQEVEGRHMYVFTNTSIAADGFHPEIYSGVGHMFIPNDAIFQRLAETAEKLFCEYNRNPNIFYTLFLYNIMSISNGFFRSIGEPEFMKLTLWIDGISGSGKTELAKAVGTYTFGDQMLNRELLAATGKRCDALKHLAQSSGSVCILDDVKIERVRDRKNNMRNIVDDLIRSTFRGRLTDPVGIYSDSGWIDACALITGEYLDTCESQNARLMYLKVDGFVDDEKNSLALRTLSQNSIWLTTVCVGYIQWFLRIMEETSFSKFLKEKLSEMRNGEKMYEGVSNSARLNENYHMLEMAAILSEMFFQEVGMSQEFITRFSRNAEQSIKTVTESTFCLLGGENMLLLKAMERIFSECDIRVAPYQRELLSFNEWKYQQEYFWIHKDEDFVWITDFKRSVLKKCPNGNEQHDEKPCLIIRLERFEELFRKAVQDLADEMQIASEIFDGLLVNPLIKLRELQIIYKQHRADSRLGRPAVNYPTYRLTEVNDFQYPDDCYCGQDYESTLHKEVICDLECEPVIQINTGHPCIGILKSRMEDNEPEDTYENVRNWQIRGITREEAYHTRKTFMNSKSLYRE